MKPYRRAVLLESVYLKIISLIKPVWFRETGGALVGYVNDRREVIVTDACGPGPRAVSQLFSIKIDGEYTGDFCNEIFRKSNGLYDYIGDWHCHPSFYIRPSEVDQLAMVELSEIKGLPDFPISVIFSRFSWKFKSYYLNQDKELEQIKRSTILKCADESSSPSGLSWSDI